jgi:hypothetical protein
MASIRREMTLDASPDIVWSAVRDIGAIHERLCPGFVVKTVLEEGARLVTFGNGMVVREVIIDLDDGARRLVWSARSERLAHHNASMQIFNERDGRTRAVWTCDLLPHEAAPAVAAMIEQGMAAMKQTFEAPSTAQ